MLPTREDLGIREVDMAGALTATGLTHVRYAAGEQVPWDPGLFLLDVESGEVEGWVRSLAALPEEEREQAIAPAITISPSNRFLSLAGVLYDRQTERAYGIDGDLAGWWGFSSHERLLFRHVRADAYVVVDSDLEPVAQLSIPSGERFISPGGGYILVHKRGSSRTFHLVNLEDEAHPRVHTWVLPWERLGAAFRTELLDNLVAFIGGAGDSACHVTRYDLGGVLLSDQTLPCQPAWLTRISPDGRLLAAATFTSLVDFSYGREPVGVVLSIFDAATGAKLARILGAHPPWIQAGWGNDPDRDVWLADGSGIIVETRYGWRVAALEGSWGDATGWASPDDPDLFLEYSRGYPGSIVAAVNQQGDERASIAFGPPSAVIPEPEYEAALVLWEDVEWGGRSDTLRVRASYFHTQHIPDYDGTPPLAPVIELPPLEDRLLVEVVVDTCLNVREEPRLDAPILTCLPHAAVAETDDFERVWSWPDLKGIYAMEQDWMHIRTAGGIEGWVSADYLRWRSDGVRLEETPANTAHSAE